MHILAFDWAFDLAFDLAAVVPWVLGTLLLAALVGVVLALATDDRDPSVVLAWLFVILLIPVLGLVAYYFVGRNYRRETRRRQELRRAAASTSERALAPVIGPGLAAQIAFVTREGTPARRIELLGRREGHAVPVPAESVRVYVAGADKFRDLLTDLRDAREYVHLMYLIWEQDRLTAEVTDVLLDRLRAGVEVRILYDWLSSLPYRKEELKRLAAAGATVVPCYKRLSQLNYRNHMKIAVIDGEIVYTGGMNMGQEYIDGGERFQTWRDTHLRMTGPVVAPYISLFATTWMLNGRPEDLVAGYVKPANGNHRPGHGVPVQVLHSSVSTEFATIRDVFVVALTTAGQRVWVQSPYFVPDEPLVTAMCAAAASGVDVRFMMTGVPDKKLPFYAAHAYYKKLLDAGVRVFQYQAGFLHSKTVTVDTDVAIIGTCNWDIRSLILHDEVMTVFYDEEIARACADQYELDLTSCSEVTLEQLLSLGTAARLRNSSYRLLSRLL